VSNIAGELLVRGITEALKRKRVWVKARVGNVMPSSEGSLISMVQPALSLPY
jgi:hypothetical protein